MHFSTIIASSALLGLALAEDHIVRVGGTNPTDLVFEPNSLTAAEGDTVTFNFWPKNHSVAQAAFASPCQPSRDGFWSGFYPTDNGLHEDSFQITIRNASQPLWYYCTQLQHCQNGMVGVINPPNSTQNTIEAFTAAARTAQDNVTPQLVAGAGGEVRHSGDHSESPSATSSGGASGTSSPTPSAAQTSGAASALQVSKGVAFTGLFGLLGYLI